MFFVGKGFRESRPNQRHNVVLMVRCGLLWKEALPGGRNVRLSWIGQNVIVCIRYTITQWRIFQDTHPHFVGGTLEAQNNCISVLVGFVVSQERRVGNWKVLDGIRRTRSVGGGLDHVSNGDNGISEIFFVPKMAETSISKDLLLLVG